MCGLFSVCKKIRLHVQKKKRNISEFLFLLKVEKISFSHEEVSIYTDLYLETYGFCFKDDVILYILRKKICLVSQTYI